MANRFGGQLRGLVSGAQTANATNAGRMGWANIFASLAARKKAYDVEEARRAENERIRKENAEIAKQVRFDKLARLDEERDYQRDIEARNFNFRKEERDYRRDIDDRNFNFRKEDRDYQRGQKAQISTLAGNPKTSSVPTPTTVDEGLWASMQSEGLVDLAANLRAGMPNDEAVAKFNEVGDSRLESVKMHPDGTLSMKLLEDGKVIGRGLSPSKVQGLLDVRDKRVKQTKMSKAEAMKDEAHALKIRGERAKVAKAEKDNQTTPYDEDMYTAFQQTLVVGVDSKKNPKFRTARPGEFEAFEKQWTPERKHLFQKKKILKKELKALNNETDFWGGRNIEQERKEKSAEILEVDNQIKTLSLTPKAKEKVARERVPKHEKKSKKSPKLNNNRLRLGRSTSKLGDKTLDAELGTLSRKYKVEDSVFSQDPVKFFAQYKR